MPKRLIANIRSRIVGEEEPIKLVVSALLAGGHVLLNDVPGVGKTLMAKTLAQSIAGIFRRIQFSPDLLPGDVTGINTFERKSGEFKFLPGPIFANILLTDEINRASPRTQSSLLEAMEEGWVTVDGVPHSLPKPFFVIATQNPVEFHGTFPLPEAQLDRFAAFVALGYPKVEEELKLLRGAWATEVSLEPVKAVLGLEELSLWQASVRRLPVAPDLQRYIVQVADLSRHHPGISLGISPRGALIWQRMSQAHAFVEGRNYVLPEDLKKTAVATLVHRIVSANRLSKEALIRDMLETVPVPV
ncbi:MAG TPA: magnesium chelatase [Cyanobacteria bacterium UBA8530]|nr:magnesium chelatase [Cyanobacteria bacterium UBA8530]